MSPPLFPATAASKLDVKFLFSPLFSMNNIDTCLTTRIIADIAWLIFSCCNFSAPLLLLKHHFELWKEAHSN